MKTGGCCRLGVWMMLLLPGGWIWAQAGEVGRTAAGEVVPVREASVEAFLRAFERASEANDADGKAALYADEVDRYFLRTHVTREFVYRDVLAWLSGGRLITRFRLTVLSAKEGRGADGVEEWTLEVRKEASWIAGNEKRVLVTRSQLVLRRVGEGWKIVGERDYKTG